MRHRKPVSLIILLSFACIFLMQSANAAETEPVYSAGRKLGRGAANVAFGWLDFFKGIDTVTKENNLAAGLTWGAIYGLGMFVTRTAAGAYEVVTFPLPIPPDYKPLVKPEFILDSNKD